VQRSVLPAPVPGQDIAAVLLIRYQRLIDEYLQEKVVDVDAWTTRFADQCDLAGQRFGATHSVDLAWIGGSQGTQQERIACSNIGGQVARQKIATF
jgi:hypothetical protein